MSTLITILTFVAAFMSIFAVNLIVADLFQQGRKEMLKRMEEELQERQRIRAKDSARRQTSKFANTAEDLGDLAAEAHQSKKAPTVWHRLRDLINQSGVETTITRLLTLCGISAIVFGLLIGFVFQSPIFGAVALALGFWIPLTYVAIKRGQRQEKLRAQLSDALELMSRILRAGQTMTQAMNSVAEEFRAPIAEEFGYCYEQQNLGLAPEVALKDLAQRTGLLEIKILVLALLVHRQTGGNLTEVLDNLARIVRERFKLRGEIKSLTTEGRVQAMILLALPVVVYLLLLLLNRSYAIKLFDHPSLIVATLTSMGFGAVWINRIVNFDF